MGSCIALKGSEMCPDFQDFTAYVNLNISSVQQFDSYMRDSVSTSPKSGFGSSMASEVLGCTGWNGTGFRYQQLAVCGLVAAQGKLFGVGGSTTSPCNPKSSVIPLCVSTMDSFVDSFNGVVANKEFCPNGGNANSLKDYINSFTSIRYLLSTTANCVGSQGNCGTPNNTGSDRNMKDSGLSANTIAIVAGSAGAGVLIIALVVTFLCCAKRSSSSSLKQRDSSLSSNILRQEAAPMGTSTQGREIDQENQPAQLLKPLNAAAIGTTQKALRDYDPQMEDELRIQCNDLIAIKTVHDDGWGCGRHQQTGKQGFFPMDIFLPPSSATNSIYTRRVSSIYESNETNLRESVYDLPAVSDFERAADDTLGYSSIYSAYDSSEFDYTPTNSYMVMYAFEPAQSDELKLQVGEKIELKQEYDDGWGYGLNLNSFKEGVFPLDCLDAVSNGEEQSYRTRRRSIFNTLTKTTPNAV
ncbi:SH3-domain kinase binding protein 1 [Chytriomyces hyalinus]|nr:SH3-domain kinase binding protein 1 [Chytriomyces hyalinus]